MTTPEAQTPSWLAHSQACDDALDRQDLAEAEAHLNAALSRVMPAKLWLLQAEVLRRKGDIAQAEQILKLACAAYPANFWPPFKLAELKHAQGDSGAAADALDLAHAANPPATLPRFHALDVEVRLAARQPARLARALTAYIPIAPKDFDPDPVISELENMPGGAAQAVPFYKSALEAEPDNRELAERFAKLLSTCPAEAALPGLELLHQIQDGALDVVLLLARTYRQLGLLDKEESLLAEAVKQHPTSPDLQRYLFRTQIAITDRAQLLDVVEGLKGKVSDRLQIELASQRALALMEFDTAATLLRRRQPQGKAPHETQMLATALIGLGRYDLALRYLRLCTRRWPQAPGLVSFHCIWALKLGRIEDARQTIENAQGKLPEANLTAHRLMLAGMQNDLDGAIECYAALRNGKQLTQQHRVTMAKLIFSLADFSQIDQIHDRIGDPLGEVGGLLHRSGLAGMMTLELALERSDYASRGGYDRIADWRHTRPNSVLPAIRLIDEWRAAAPEWPKSPEIPKRIFQYWDAASPPEAVIEMSESWSSAPGYSHELFSRKGAVAFLRDKFGPRWLRAFEMARNPAEEADLLRLCLLVQFGGIWADADDRLYGNLDALLAGSGGLVLYREPLGGTLGNNFIAAPPGHPALIFAAKLVRRALLERTADIAWAKTGPGVLTRAVAHYLVQTEIPRDDHPLSIIEGDRIARVIAMHNPVRYKTLASHWAKGEARNRPSQLWPNLLEALRSAP
ncbi:tetratricopeptide repeat protein [Primorskyibacter sp. 2E233]|uniref:tetratricopeptide repeat protein n=1 Tax=Primorskyibacter sp. 2E233 TaxID=3413431 RepID=UPI003BF0E568